MCLSCTIEEITGVDLSTDEGHDALEKMGRIPWPIATDEMQEAAAYIAALYANPEGATGGPLHITTDDFNVEDENLAFCRKEIGQWEPYTDDEAAAHRVKVLSDWVLDLLEPMTAVERSICCALAHNYLSQIHGHIYMPNTEFPIREEVRDDDGNLVGTQWGFRSRTVKAQ